MNWVDQNTIIVHFNGSQKPWNVKNINRIIGADLEHKVSLLLSHAGDYRDIADPWYTGNFDDTYRDIVKGCEAFLKHLREE